MRRAAMATFAVAIICVAILFMVSFFSQHAYYQFTTYQIKLGNEDRTMTWVSKTAGRIQCSELEIFKRNQPLVGIVTDAFCVDGKDNVGEWIEATNDEWLKEKFNQKVGSQGYGHFRDKLGNDSLIYFSNANNSGDQNTLEELVRHIKGKVTGWTWVQPSAPLSTQ